MKLCIDAGNTRIKWGVHDGHRWVEKGSCATAAAHELAAQLALIRADSCLVSNVAGPAVAAKICTAVGMEPQWLTPVQEGRGLKIHYDCSRLGSDRYAALIGALSFAPCVVVCAGTAITLDGLGAGGVVYGGLILPGRRLLTGVWEGATHALSADVGRVCDWPKTTADALESGRIWAVIGAIEHLRATLPDQDVPISVVLSGGDADWLLPHLGAPCQAVADIVLEGLACVE